MKWTNDLISEVWALWIDGVSAAQIARRMSHKLDVEVTKNMIVGAVHRHGNKTGRRRPKKETAAKPAPKVKAMPMAKVTPPPRDPALVALEASSSKGSFKHANRRLKIVPGHTCKYLHGEPADRNFCGAPAVTDLDYPAMSRSWCAEHLTMVLIPRSSVPQKKAVRANGRVVWIAHPKAQTA